jgi:hypothetical protein
MRTALLLVALVSLGSLAACSSSSEPAALSASGSTSTTSSAGGGAGGAHAGGGGGSGGTSAGGAHHVATSVGDVTAIWANDGGDKVARSELRVAHPNGRKVKNAHWDGATIRLDGARDEVVGFDLVLEASAKKASGVRVSLAGLTGPGGATIQSKAAHGDEVFDWQSRPIELFYVQYLRIRGLSQLGWESYYDERHAPARMRRPWTGQGTANDGTTWADRPDHDAEYPEIAVPLELVPSFDVEGGTNQSVFCDVWIPRGATPGVYTGFVHVEQGEAEPADVPVELTVRPFTLPDAPSAKTMLAWSPSNVNERYLGKAWIDAGPEEERARRIHDRHALLAHRHRISLVGDGTNLASDDGAGDRPSPSVAARLRGDFFTAAHAYEGPGEGVPNDVYAVGLYGSWQSWGDTEAHVRAHSDAWITWLDANAPGVERFLYLADETDDYASLETWSKWLAENPGPGSALASMATIPLPAAVANVPSLRVPTSAASFGPTSAWAGAAAKYTSDPALRFYLYNGSRPGSGSFMTEDDGVALRANAWIQWKEHVARWFYWESTYYDDFQGGSGKLDVFESAHTFGTLSKTDPVLGETGWNYSNGDGVLFYPGTDVLFPAHSHGVDGPFASLRLKAWRRGIQDHAYLSLAWKADPAATTAIVAEMVPSVVWEMGVDDPADPTYLHADISWPSDPDAWEAARAKLAAVIEKGGP